MRVLRSRRVVAFTISSICMLALVLAGVRVLPAYAANPPRLGHLTPAGHATPGRSGIISRSTASISLSKNSYPPTALLEVSGSGFGAGEDVDIYFDKADLALAKSDGGGNFSGIVIQVPASAVPGTHWVTATGRASGQSAQAPFLVSTNWNQFGFSPSHQAFNHYENVLSPSNVGQLHLAWTTTPIGMSVTSPAIAGGNVYTVENADTLYGYNQLTGKATWRGSSTGFYEQYIAVNYLSVNGTPTWVLFTSSYTDTTSAVDAYKLSGCKTAPCPLLWKQSMDADARITYANGVVYAASDDAHIYAFDAATGARLWTSAAAGDSFVGAPAVVGGVVYAGTFDAYLYALNASNGALLWKGALLFEASTSPTVAAGMVYIGTRPGEIYAFKSSGCGSAICGPLWTAVVGSYLETDVAYANGVVYAAPFDGGLYAYAATGCGQSECSPLWIGAMQGGIGSDISVANGVVYASSGGYYGGQLYAFAAAGCGVASCNPLWTYTLPNHDSLPGIAPIISNGMLYAMAFSGTLYVFRLPATVAAPLRPSPAALHPNLALRRTMPRLTPLLDMPDQ